MAGRLRPYLNRVRRFAAGQPSLVSAAAGSTIIAPGEEGATPASIYLTSELDKIDVVNCETTREIENRRITGGPCQHSPLIRYEFADALLFPNGFSLANASFERFGPLPHRDLLLGQARSARTATYCLNAISTQYFGHWLMDGCATSLLCEEEELSYLPIRPDWPDTLDYRDLFSLPLPEPNIYSVERLYLYSDLGDIKNRRARVAQLRSRLRSSINNQPEQTTRFKRIYLRRGTSGASRMVANDEALSKFLIKAGFEIIDMEKHSAKAIHARALEAEICLTMEGSNHGHAFMFLKPGGVLMNIQPSDRFNAVARDRTAAIGQNYAFVVATKTEDGYYVDINSLGRTIDLAERSLN